MNNSILSPEQRLILSQHFTCLYSHYAGQQCWLNLTDKEILVLDTEIAKRALNDGLAWADVVGIIYFGSPNAKKAPEPIRKLYALQIADNSSSPNCPN
jgi:sugar lactone lactonase YvrE